MPGPCTELASARPETLRWHCAGTRSPAHAVAGAQLAICMARAMESPAITIERPCITRALPMPVNRFPCTALVVYTPTAESRHTMQSRDTCGFFWRRGSADLPAVAADTTSAGSGRSTIAPGVARLEAFLKPEQRADAEHRADAWLAKHRR